MKNPDVQLKPLGDHDIDRIVRWLQDDTIRQYYGGRDRPMPSRGEIEERYGGQGNPDVLMIYMGSNPVGFLSVFRFDEAMNIRHGLGASEGNVFAFDIVLGEVEHQNKGVGSAAVNALLATLFFTRGAEKVVLDTYVWHKQAIRCYEKCGFTATRVLTDHDIYEGMKTDDVFMEITKAEFVRSYHGMVE